MEECGLDPGGSSALQLNPGSRVAGSLHLPEDPISSAARRQSHPYCWSDRGLHLSIARRAPSKGVVCRSWPDEHRRHWRVTDPRAPQNGCPDRVDQVTSRYLENI